MKSYAIPAFCIHNTNGYNLLPWEYWKSYLYIRRKWTEQLPIASPCANITFLCGPMITWNIRRATSLLLGRYRAVQRVEDPVAVYRGLVERGLIAAPAGESETLSRTTA
jgi:hypothetical protein